VTARKIRAYGGGVLVNEIDTTTATYGLIQVQRFEPAVLVSGRVLSVGHKVHDAIEVAVGDRVWFRRQCGVELGTDDVEDENGNIIERASITYVHQGYLDAEIGRAHV
jgi:co-chaperonin GroES (HSP10)